MKYYRMGIIIVMMLLLVTPGIIFFMGIGQVYPLYENRQLAARPEGGILTCFVVNGKP